MIKNHSAEMTRRMACCFIGFILQYLAMCFGLIGAMTWVVDELQCVSGL